MPRVGNPDRHIVPEDMRKEIGKRVYAAYDSRGWTQTQFADEVGLNSGSVSAIVRGKQSPSLALLVHMAQRMGMPPAELLGGKGDKSIDYQVGYRHGYLAAIDRLGDAIPPLPEKQTRD